MDEIKSEIESVSYDGNTVSITREELDVLREIFAELTPELRLIANHIIDDSLDENQSKEFRQLLNFSVNTTERNSLTDED